MKKRLLPMILILATAILIALGIFMPKITFSYQNDTLLAQVEIDQVDETSFLYSSDNDILNALQIISAGNYMMDPDDREVNSDNTIPVKREVTYFLELLNSYSEEYAISHGYVGNYHTINLYPGFYGPYSIDPYLLTYSYNSVFYDYEITDSYGSSSTLYDNDDSSDWYEQSIWAVSSNESREDSGFLLYVDENSGKVCSFYLYDYDSDDNYITVSDITKYCYMFTTLFTDYYGLTVTAVQSDTEDLTDMDVSDTRYDEATIYFVVADPSNPENSTTVSIYISCYFISFN